MPLKNKWPLFWLLVVIVVLINLPILSLIFNSLRSTENLLSSGAFDVSNLSFQNYIYVSSRTRFWTFFWQQHARVRVGRAARHCPVGACWVRHVTLPRADRRFVLSLAPHHPDVPTDPCAHPAVHPLSKPESHQPPALGHPHLRRGEPAFCHLDV